MMPTPADSRRVRSRRPARLRQVPGLVQGEEQIPSLAQVRQSIPEVGSEGEAGGELVVGGWHGELRR